MQWHLPISINAPDRKIAYQDKLLLTGSCFTEHIGKGLSDLKFDVLQNPHGILFGVDAICQSLEDYLSVKKYTTQDLFHLNGVWNCWNHHSVFSDTMPDRALEKINNSITNASNFLKQSDHIVLTLGSSFCYRLTAEAQLASKKEGGSVANCHRAPALWFTKELLPVEWMVERLGTCISKLRELNPSLQVILTVSPVRHIRDGVQENNRSKARLFETIQRLEEKGFPIYYFPAFEIVVDVLRDYRFYDIDLVHPNFAATDYVIEQFMKNCVDSSSQELANEIKKLRTAFRHRPQHGGTTQHKEFLNQMFQKAAQLQSAYSFLDFSAELSYFSAES